MLPRIIITGSIQCGKTTLVRSILDEIHLNVSGYYSQKKWNPEKKEMEIWLIDFNSCLSKCFATKKETGNFTTNIGQFDWFINKIFTSNIIARSEIFCIDEIGFLEKNSRLFIDYIQTFSYCKMPVILVIQKRILPDIRQLLKSPPWKLFDLDSIESISVKEKIIAQLNDLKN